LFPFAAKTYQELEKLTGTKFYFPKKIIRTIHSEAERNEWNKKKEAYAGYLEGAVIQLPADITIQKGGNLRVGHFIDAMRRYFADNNLLVEEALRHDELIMVKDGIQWREYFAKRLIFCEGYKALFNPWFSRLPFTHAKGEILTIEAPGLETDHIISRGIFILPIGNGYYKVGSTYDWEDLTEHPTEKGKNELTGKLDKIIKIPYRVVEHQAGIRPTVKDRRPLLGLHGSYPHLGIFNGLGTKGVTLAPWFAHHLVIHFEEGKEILKEVDIRRFEGMSSDE
jgi:glycine/D-amino acid oxidase-like deaminating enzyme